MADQAVQNLSGLRRNPYPGRGIIVGMDSAGKLVQIYWIMGRSENSRARILVKGENGDVRTAPTKPMTEEESKLIIYRAMAEHNGVYVVSNGAQTDSIVEWSKKGLSPMAALGLWGYEPDAPNYTPRISAGTFLTGSEQPHSKVVSISRGESGKERHQTWTNTPHTDYGVCITTYSGDGNPLPSFIGSPYLVPIPSGDPETLAGYYWNCLNQDNRVAIAAKVITEGCSETHIINRFEA